ncbi:MAG: acyl-CoA thioesterase [Deltaproteobacteria bacterium]|nr:MAG: acyl-CoA thioesterase [Deltaproteobacteria bacterium]RUA03541.1 MAG: acyl-CoA thioesterase [Deltaproteobacteria bacterium]
MKPKPFQPETDQTDTHYIKDLTDGRFWHRCTHRILYADTDRSQVVYHANYLRYFELGRASLMRDTGYPYREVEKSGFIYPIIAMGVNYFTPLYYDDPIFVHTRPAEMERVRLRFEYVITHRETGEVICNGFTRHCATNTTGTPVGIDKKTIRLWKNFPR